MFMFFWLYIIAYNLRELETPGVSWLHWDIFMEPRFIVSRTMKRYFYFEEARLWRDHAVISKQVAFQMEIECVWIVFSWNILTFFIHLCVFSVWSFSMRNICIYVSSYIFLLIFVIISHLAAYRKFVFHYYLSIYKKFP